jgi:hypothetical protein
MKAFQPKSAKQAKIGGVKLARPRGRPPGQRIAITYTVGAWATALGRDARTLTTKLHRAGIRTVPGQLVTAMEIAKALLDEERQLKNRNLLRDAEAKELDLKVKRGDLHPTAMVEEEIARTFGKVRDAILFIRAALPSRANPQDPQCARRAWDQLETQYWPWMRGAVNGSQQSFPDPWAEPEGQTENQEPRDRV